MTRWLRFCLSLSLLLGVIITYPPQPSHAQGNGLPVYEPDACPFDALPGQAEGQTYECGYLIVPENRADPASPEIALAIVIIYSDSPNPLPDPIVYLEGGPGGSAVAGLDAWIGTPFSANRNIILIDQRGTGYSEPSLNCWELDEGDEDQDPFQACYDRLVSEGIDLGAYNSRENAADINDLRVALGLDQINLYGISYGTRLALTVLRDYPEGVRSVVIDGVFPPHVQGYEEQPLYGARAFNQLFTDCAADPACNAAYPNLESTFYQVVDQLNADPYVVETENGEDVVLGDSLVNAIYQAFYATSIVPNLPLAISLISNGYVDVGMEIIEGLPPEELLGIAAGPEEEAIDENIALPSDIDADAEGMFNSVECNEEVSFQTYDQTVALSSNIVPQIREAMLAGVDEQFATCAFWNSGVAGAVENAPVVSNVPTLVLSGSYDPVTPPAWGQAAADYLSNSYNFVFPGVGHGSIDGGDCPVGIGAAFIDNPTVAPDSSCIAAMRVSFFTQTIPAEALGPGAAVGGGTAGQSPEQVQDAILAVLNETGWSLAEFQTDFLDFEGITMDDLVAEIIDGFFSIDELLEILSE